MSRPPAKRPPAERWPHLARLCSAYVHQDWDLEGPTPDPAVQRFAREVAPEVVEGACADIASLLKTTRSEAALDTVLNALACAYRPVAAGTTARAWLTRVRVLLHRRSGV